MSKRNKNEFEHGLMMDDLFVFEKDNGKNKNRFYVSPEWFKKKGHTPSDVSKTELYSLFNELNLADYLHNPKGDAMMHIEYDDSCPYGEVWLEGKQIDDPEQLKKFRHDLKFNQGVNDWFKHDFKKYKKD